LSKGGSAGNDQVRAGLPAMRIRGIIKLYNKKAAPVGAAVSSMEG